jgi:predicted secreted Zn-dependent protease
MKDPWAAAWQALRQHEGRHEQVAKDARTNFESSITAMAFVETARSESAAKTAAHKEAMAEWSSMLKQHASDQADLDPYEVTIDCP